MSNPNPFASPQAAPGIGGGPGMDGGLSARAATILSQTRGWVIFYAVLLYLVAAMFLVGVAVAGSFVDEIPQLDMLGGLVAVVFLFVMGYVLVEAILLTIFAAKIGGYLRSRNPGEIAAGLKNMKVFWIFEGIRLVIFAIFGVIGLLAVLSQM